MGVPRMSAADKKEAVRREAMSDMIRCALLEDKAMEEYQRMYVHAPEAEKEALYRRTVSTRRNAERAYNRARRLGLVD